MICGVRGIESVTCHNTTEFRDSGAWKYPLQRLSQPPVPVPTLSKLMVFRMARTSIRLMLDETSRDFTYYREKGWFESDYFYPVRLGLFKNAAVRLFDCIASRRAKNTI